MKHLTATEAMFYDYLLTRGYRRSTAKDYAHRIRKIGSIDALLHQDITPYIEEYTIGAHQEDNKRVHNAYSGALKRLQEMQRDKGIL